MKVKLSTSVMKNKQQNEEKKKVMHGGAKSKVNQKKKYDKLDADKRLSNAINKNIELMMSQRALAYGSKLKVLKPPRQGEVKERRLHLMNKLITKVSKEFHTPSADKMIEAMEVETQQSKAEAAKQRRQKFQADQSQ